MEGLALEPQRMHSVRPATSSNSMCGMPSSREVLGADLSSSGRLVTEVPSAQHGPESRLPEGNRGQQFRNGEPLLSVRGGWEGPPPILKFPEACQGSIF